MGPATSGVQFQAGALEGIGDTIAIGHVVYFGDTPFIVAESYTPASRNIAAHRIIPIGGIDIFVGFNSVQAAYEAIPTQPAPDAETAVEVGFGSTLSTDVVEFQIGENSTLTLSTLEEEIVVENRSTSVLQVEGPDYDQCHFMGHVDSVLGSCKGGEDPESVLQSINEECGDSYSDISTGTTPIRQEKVTRRVHLGRLMKTMIQITFTVKSGRSS
jgi:hypothetical protein